MSTELAVSASLPPASLSGQGAKLVAPGEVIAVQL